MKIEIIDASGPSVPLGFGGFFMHGMKIEPTEPQPELPEFRFSPREVRTVADLYADHARDYLRFLTKRPPAPLRIVGRPGPAMPARIRKTTEARKHVGTADPIWDVQFSLKFSKDPSDKPALTVPEGTASPLQAFSDKVAEIAWLRETQERDIPTTLDLFRKNRIPVMSLNYQPREDPKVRALKADRGEPLPAFIRLPDRVVEDKATGMTYTEPRYGDAKYIAAMRNQIEWERWRSANGSLLRAQFLRLRDGRLGIAAVARQKDAEHSEEAKLALKRQLKAAWLANHDALPTADDIAAYQKRIEGTRLIEAMTPEEREAWERRQIDDPEDHDPGRVGFHADPDPQPTRDQYPFGDHRHCEIAPAHLNVPDLHRGCTDDGWERYNEDLAIWLHAAEKRGEITYAGPHGGLGTDTKSKVSNPFFRKDEDETERADYIPSIQCWRSNPE